MSVNKVVPVPKIEVKIDYVSNDPNSVLKAFARVIIADSFVVNGVKVLDAGKGLFFAMPSRKYEKDGQERHADICHAVTKETYKKIKESVLDAYKKRLEEQK